MSETLQKINTKGPVLIRFHSKERDSGGLRFLKVYIDVTKILVIREWGSGTRVILEGDVPCDLADSCDEVIDRLAMVMEERL